MARFRRKPRVTWTQIPVDGAPVALCSYQRFAVNFAAGSNSGATSEIVVNMPIVPDFPLGPVSTVLETTGVRGYRLRRVVGKIYVEQQQTNDQQPAVLTCAGLIIRRVDPNTGIAEATLPQSSPLRGENMQDPWCWRRTWITQNQPAGIGAFGTFGQNNAQQAPSALDGPHIDCKTNRKVQNEERAFLSFSFQPLGTTGIGVPSLQMNLLFDLRVLISPLAGISGNRGNAVR